MRHGTVGVSVLLCVWSAEILCLHRKFNVILVMINWNRFKYEAKAKNQNGMKRQRSSNSEEPDNSTNENNAKDDHEQTSVKRSKCEFFSNESGSDNDENSLENGKNSPDVFADTPDSLESPLISNKKKAFVLSKNHIDKKSSPKKNVGKSSNGLGLSSSDSEEEDDKADTSRRAFPRLSCGISANSPVAATKSKDNGTASKVVKERKADRIENHEESRASKENDESFTIDREDDDFDSSDDEFPNFGKAKRAAVLDFLQNASMDELITVESCSQKKADVIVSLRPYRTWDDATVKMSTTKFLSPDLLYSCADLLKQRQILKQLLDQCQNISSVLTKAIEKLHCSDEMTDGITSVETPSVIPSHLKLKPYQLVGLNWMVLLHRNKVNGVLADEMGLGKTIQTISFLAHLFEQDPNTGPHLIVVPSSTLGNWHREFNVWCPTLEVILYQGSQADRRGIRVAFSRGMTSNVIITTYNSAISTAEDRSFFRKLEPEYAIYDEGHMLKNMLSQRYVNLMKMKAKRKLLLTGTPLQNNLLELMSLLRFVMPQMFEQTTESLVRIFKNSNSESKSKYALDRIADAKNIMQPFVLRRLKSAVLKQLPSKVVETVLCEMTDEQKDVYEKTKEMFRLGMHKKSAMEMKSAFTELRKAANHPLLRRYHYPVDSLTKMAKLLKDHDSTYLDSVERLIVEDLTVMTDFEIHEFCLTTPSIRHFALEKTAVLNSGKLKTLDKMLPQIKAQNDKVVIFSQWVMIIDILEKYLKFRGYKFLRLDGSTPVNTRLDLIDKFESNPEITVFLLSTKAGGLGINLTAANQVILHDIDLNPHNDRQAEDRCHRLGQTKDVKITKLIAKDSIEEGMLQLAHNKLRLQEQLSAEKDETADIATLIQNTLSN